MHYMHVKLRGRVLVATFFSLLNIGLRIVRKGEIERGVAASALRASVSMKVKPVGSQIVGDKRNVSLASYRRKQIMKGKFWLATPSCSEADMPTKSTVLSAKDQRNMYSVRYMDSGERCEIQGVPLPSLLSNDRCCLQDA